MIVAVESEYDAASIRPLPRACQRRSRQLPQRNFFRPLLILRVFAVLNVECQMPSTRTIGVLCECDRAIKDQVKKTVRTTSAACNVLYNINHWSRSSEGLSRDLSIRPDGSDRKAANEHVQCVLPLEAAVKRGGWSEMVLFAVKRLAATVSLTDDGLLAHKYRSDSQSSAEAQLHRRQRQDAAVFSARAPFILKGARNRPARVIYQDESG